MKTTSAIRGGFTTLAIAGSLFTGTAFAQTNASTTAAPSLLDKFTASYWGIFNGPGLGDVTNVNTPSVDDQGALGDGDPMNFDGLVMAGYKLPKDRTIGIGIPFVFTPVNADANLDLDAKLKDPFVRVIDSKLITAGTFSMWADLRAYAGLSGASRTANKVTGIRSTQISSYDIPNTRYSLGVATIERANIYVGGTSGNDGQLVFSPFATITLTPKMQLTVWNDLYQLDHARGADLLDWSNEPIDLQVGLNYDITPSVSLNPYINMYPAHPTLDASSFQMIISAKFL